MASSAWCLQPNANLIAGRSAITPEMAVRLEQALGSTADTWLRMQANYDLAQIRARTTPIKIKRLAPKVASVSASFRSAPRSWRIGAR
jgi:plasmid maintenance system antidote protein VapI